MTVKKYRIALFSENPDTLFSFYTKILGLTPVVKVDRDDDYGYGIEAAPGYKLWIARHSKVRGKSVESFRIMLSLYVDDINSYFERVRQFDKDLIIKEPILTCSNIVGEERWAGAFLDPDGNCLQIMQMTGN